MFCKKDIHQYSVKVLEKQLQMRSFLLNLWTLILVNSLETSSPLVFFKYSHQTFLDRQCNILLMNNQYYQNTSIWLYKYKQYLLSNLFRSSLHQNDVSKWENVLPEEVHLLFLYWPTTVPDTRAFVFARQLMERNFTWLTREITASICVVAQHFHLRFFCKKNLILIQHLLYFALIPS